MKYRHIIGVINMYSIRFHEIMYANSVTVWLSFVTFGMKGVSIISIIARWIANQRKST